METKRRSIGRLAATMVLAALGAGTVLAGPAEQARETKGWLGVWLEERGGEVVVRNVTEDSPAERAGLRDGDVVLAVDGKKVTSAGDVSAAVAARRPGESVRVELRRDGKELEVDAALGERPRRFGMFRPGPHGPAWSGFGKLPNVRLGVVLQPLTDGLRSYFRVPEGKGVLVAEVGAESPAGKAGIRAGDVIVTVNGKEVASQEDVLAALEGLAVGERAALGLVREGAARTIDVLVEERPAERGFLGGHGCGPGSGASFEMPAFDLESLAGPGMRFEMPALDLEELRGLEMEGLSPEARERLRQEMKGVREKALEMVPRHRDELRRSLLFPPREI